MKRLQNAPQKPPFQCFEGGVWPDLIGQFPPVFATLPVPKQHIRIWSEADEINVPEIKHSSCFFTDSLLGILPQKSDFKGQNF